ncbi:hypothetical protein ES703_23680 [subsurface metagenome]
MGLPTVRNIEASEKLYERLSSWKIADDTITIYFGEHLRNVEAAIIVVKVVLISTLYYARIFEPLKMASHIMGLQGLDSELTSGDTRAVERIATFNRYEMSFASKYAHFHNREAFPLCDHFAAGAIAILQGKKFSYPKYTDFFTVITSFRQQSGLNSIKWGVLDKYLWLYGQKKDLDKGKGVNKEVTALYNTAEGKILFDALEP